MTHTQLASIHVEYFLRINGSFPVDFHGFKRIFPSCNSAVLPEQASVRYTFLLFFLNILILL